MTTESLYSFSKNSMEQVRAFVSEFKGKSYINLRVFFEDDKDTWRPTKKGLTLDPALLPELKAAVLALEKAVPKNKVYLRAKRYEK